MTTVTLKLTLKDLEGLCQHARAELDLASDILFDAEGRGALNTDHLVRRLDEARALHEHLEAACRYVYDRLPQRPMHTHYQYFSDTYPTNP